MTLGEHLRELRKAAGLSQEEVANRLFLSRQSVSKWENDDAEPGIENLKALAGLYGVTLDDLLLAEGENQAAEQGKEPEGERLYRYWALGIVVFTVMLGFFTIADYGRMQIPLFIIAAVIGLWVKCPAMWVVILCAFGLGIVLGVINLLNGSASGLIDIVVGSLSIWIICRPSVRGRFHMR